VGAILWALERAWQIFFLDHSIFTFFLDQSIDTDETNTFQKIFYPAWFQFKFCI